MKFNPLIKRCFLLSTVCLFTYVPFAKAQTVDQSCHLGYPCHVSKDESVYYVITPRFGVNYLCRIRSTNANKSATVSMIGGDDYLMVKGVGLHTAHPYEEVHVSGHFLTPDDMNDKGKIKISYSFGNDSNVNCSPE